MNVPLFRPCFPEAIRQDILRDIDAILASGKLMMGPFKDNLEQRICQTVGTSHAVSVNTCTTALTMCLKYFGASGHEVLVPSGTFITSVSSVIFAGGTPVLVDMNPDTLSFDLDDLKAKLTPQTKGLVWVHLTGIISPQYEEIIAFARENGLFVIEDCAHAMGAEVPGGAAGSLGDAGCFSFYPTKIITCGTGGAITTNDQALADYAEKMRVFCKDPSTQEIDGLGNDWFLDEIRACVAWHQMGQLDAQLKARRNVAARYRELLADVPVRLLGIPSGNLPSYYQFPVFIAPDADHGALMKALKKRGVHCKMIYKPTHQEVCFRHLDDGSLGKTESTLHSSVCLPLSVTMSEEEINHVVTSLKTELGNA